MKLLIENNYEKVKYLGNIKRPSLNISFEIGNRPFTYPFRPDTGFITYHKSDKYCIKGCERLKKEIQKKGIFGRSMRIQVADGNMAKVTVFEGVITKISGVSGSIKPEDMKVILSCTGCRNKKLIKRKISRGTLPDNTICLQCLKHGAPNVFGFDLMNLWIAEFNGPDQKFSIKSKDV